MPRCVGEEGLTYIMRTAVAKIVLATSTNRLMDTGWKGNLPSGPFDMCTSTGARPIKKQSPATSHTCNETRLNAQARAEGVDCAQDVGCKGCCARDSETAMLMRSAASVDSKEARAFCGCQYMMLCMSKHACAPSRPGHAAPLLAPAALHKLLPADRFQPSVCKSRRQSWQATQHACIIIHNMDV